MDKHQKKIDPLDERYQAFYNDISTIVVLPVVMLLAQLMLQ